MGGVSGKEVQRVVIVTGFRWARERLKGGGDLGVWGLHWRRRCHVGTDFSSFFHKKMLVFTMLQVTKCPIWLIKPDYTGSFTVWGGT